MCVCHLDTPVRNENTTLLQPSTSLRPSSPPTRLPATDHVDGFTKLMCYSFGSQCSGTRTRQHSCVLVLSGWIPKHVRDHAVANPRWVTDAPDTTTLHLFRKDVHLQFQCVGKLFGGRSITGTDVAELSGRQIPTSMLRSHGRVCVSRVSCLLFAGLPASSLKHRTSAHETAQLLRKSVELDNLISRLGDTLRGSQRRLH